MTIPPEKLDAIKEELQNDVRPSLALERTVLANERTLMSYLRTMVAISGALHRPGQAAAGPAHYEQPGY